MQPTLRPHFPKPTARNGDWLTPLPRGWMTSNRKPRGTRSIGFKSNSIGLTKKFYRRRNRMLSQAQRTPILELNTQGVGKREIARVLGISRVAVRKSCDPTRPFYPNCTEPRRPSLTCNRSWSFSRSARAIPCESKRSWWRAAPSCRIPR